MKGFIQNIISRQINPAANTTPRLPGKFEPSNFNPGISTELFTPSTNTSYQESFDPVNTGNNNNIVAQKNTNAFAAPVLSTEKITQHIHHPKGPGINSVQKINIPVEHINAASLSTNIKNLSNNIPGKIKNDEEHIFSKHEQKGNEGMKTNIPHHGSVKVIESFKENLPGKKEFERQDGEPIYGTQNSNMPAGRLFSDVYNTPSTPVIKISIGRIEVRAVSTASPINVTRETVQKPKMSLEEYLNKRNNH